ncbi:hypothetical protein PENTCL1PPCAC_30145, partial [Pristionchus entomophagus]
SAMLRSSRTSSPRIDNYHRLDQESREPGIVSRFLDDSPRHMRRHRSKRHNSVAFFYLIATTTTSTDAL